MRRCFLWPWLLAGPLLVIPLACSKTHQRRPPAADPLLISKTPVQAKYGKSDLQGRPDPMPPAMPAGVWVNAPMSPGGGAAQLGSPESMQPPPGPFRFTSEKRTGEPERLQRRRGSLEKVSGRWVLDGKVLLEGHPQLDLFEPGDVIEVEGYQVEGESRSGAWLPHPRFRVEHVQLIRRKS